jgi:hypothetical protein
VIVKSLPDWEEQLHPYLDQIELLAEVPLSRVEHGDLETSLKRYLQNHGITRSTRDFQERYPAAFATYLAFKAAFNAERDFWGNVAVSLGMNDKQVFYNAAHHWGDTFLQILHKHHLRTFEGVAGQDYITAIRLHGGISAYSLPDFFEYILLPSLQKDEWRGQDDVAALQGLLKTPAVQYFVDDPVQHFFKHGGEAATRFFQKCRYLARLSLAGEPLPAASDLGLRPYVVQIFESYRQNPPEPAQRRRLPRSFFEPDGPGWRLLLPAQPIPFERAQMLHYWEIRLLDNNQELSCERLRARVRRYGPDWQTEEIEYLVEQPVGAVQISLTAQTEFDSQICFRRALRLLPTKEKPLLAFRYTDHAPRASTPTLSAEDLWLFYPVDVDLHIEGRYRVIEQLHPFAMPWQQWQAQAYDLQQAHAVRLLRGSRDICPPLPIAALYEPELQGESPHPNCLPVEEKPLFLGTPHLLLPVRDLESPEEELRHWELCLEARQEAFPVGQWKGTAADLPTQFNIEDHTAVVDLQPWLGTQPVGTYQITVSDPNHSCTELPFRVWPELQVSGLKPYYLPDLQGIQPIAFQLRLPPRCQVVSLGEDELAVQAMVSDFCITVPATTERAALWLEYPAQPVVVRVPVQFAISHLRWALQLETAAPLEWQLQLLRLPVARLLQSREPRLLLELPFTYRAELLAELHLMDSGTQQTLQTAPDFELGGRHTGTVINLGQFADTLRQHTATPTFDLTLKILDANCDALLTVPLLRLTRQLTIDACQMEFLPERRWRLHWHEPNPLRYRRLRLWSLWRPWTEPREFPLPDAPVASSISESETGWWQADLPEGVILSPGWYRAQFVIVAPDDAELFPNLPPLDTLGLTFIAPQERLFQIDQELTQYPHLVLELHFERACVLDSLGQMAERSQEIQWCLTHWQTAKLSILFTLQEWLKDREPASQRAARMYMFHSETLNRLFAGRYSAEFIERYLECLLSVRTINPNSAYLILQHTHSPAVLARALDELLRAQDARAIEYLIWQMSAGQFSDADAQQILNRYHEFALEALSHLPATAIRDRLLLYLVKDQPQPERVVLKGYWIHCDAGWGRIEEIRESETGVTREFFVPECEQPYLVVTLRPEIAPETVHLDLAQKRLSFPQAPEAYLCTNESCEHFISTDRERVLRGHNRAAHQGIGAAVRTLKPPQRTWRHALEYSTQPPNHLFV